MAGDDAGGDATGYCTTATSSKPRRRTVAAPPKQVVASIALDDLFAMLKNERRRCVLGYLADHGGEGPVSLSDLAEHLASRENDKPVAQLRSDERKRVYVALYQVHLPQLDESGILNFNKSRGIVEPGKHFETCLWYLDRATGTDDTPRQPRFYAVVSAIGVVGLVLATWMQPRTTVPVTDLAAVAVVVAFCGCTGWYWLNREVLDTADTTLET